MHSADVHMHVCAVCELHMRGGLVVSVSGFMCATADEFDPAVTLSRAESSERNEERQREAAD